MRSSVLAAVAIRLAVVLLAAPEPERVFNSDSYDFETLAVNLLATGHFSRDETPPFRPEGIRTPLYPVVVAGFYAALGERPVFVLLGNVLLAGAIALLLARADPRAGPAASWLYALDPASIVYGALFVAETLLTALVLLAVVRLARALAGESSRPWLDAFAGGVALGLAVLCKPVATYLPLGLLPAALLLRRRRVPALALGAVFTAAMAAVVLPWVARNHEALGVAQVSTIQEINLLYWNVGVLEGGRLGRDFRSSAAELGAEVERRAGRPADAIPAPERARLERAVALERIRAHPLAYAWVHLRGALATALDPGRLDFARLLGGLDWNFSFLSALTAEGVGGVARALAARPKSILLLLALSGCWLALFWAAAARGLWRARRDLGSDPLLLLALVTAAYLVLIGGPIGNARFRVPLVPFAALYAAIGLEREVERDGS